jgi:hypothetical protein
MTYPDEILEARRLVRGLSRFEGELPELRLHGSGRAVAVASGCSSSVAHLVSTLLKEVHGISCDAMTPYCVSQTTRSFDLGVLISARSTHVDVFRALSQLREKCARVLIIGCSASEGLADRLGRASGVSYVPVPVAVPNGGFVPVASTVATFLWSAALFGGTSMESLCTAFELGVSAEGDHALPAGVTATGPILVACAPWAEPAVRDFETRIVESGIGAVSWTDPWNLAHGRYMPLARHSGGLLVLCGSAADHDAIVNVNAVVGRYVSSVVICAPTIGVLATSYCLGALIELHCRLASHLGLDPANPNNPEWGRQLYDSAGKEPGH